MGRTKSGGWKKKHAHMLAVTTLVNFKGKIQIPQSKYFFFQKPDENMEHLFFFFFFFGCAAPHVGSQFPNQGSNPHPLQWKRRVPTTGPPGKSPGIFILNGMKLLETVMLDHTAENEKFPNCFVSYISRKILLKQQYSL